MELGEIPHILFVISIFAFIPLRIFHGSFIIQLIEHFEKFESDDFYKCRNFRGGGVYITINFDHKNFPNDDYEEIMSVYIAISLFFYGQLISLILSTVIFTLFSIGILEKTKCAPSSFKILSLCTKLVLN